ncbi:hypothetical protein LX36DRAFT_661357 [Colletotrichum falcatum]|nr:hypothetical protein LX36DRAFT_661357 [Colletotrichum falcatum]
MPSCPYRYNQRQSTHTVADLPATPFVTRGKAGYESCASLSSLRPQRTKPAHEYSIGGICIEVGARCVSGALGHPVCGGGRRKQTDIIIPLGGW